MNANRSLHRTIFAYVSKNILSMIGLSCYILADTYFISNRLGSDGVAALNLVLPIYSIINGIGLMLGMGAATRYAILQGEGKTKEASQVFTHVLCFGAACALLLTVIGLLFSHSIAAALGAAHSILPLAGTYLRTLMLFSSAFILNNIVLCMVRNDGQPALAMAAMLTGSLCNIVLDYIFMFPLPWGMFGAAFATGLAPIISMAVLSIHFIRRTNQFHLVASRPSLSYITRSAAVGAPYFLTEFSSGLVMFSFNFIILRMVGDIGVAAYGIVANLAFIVVSVFTGIAQGVQPIISRSVGEHNDFAVKRTYLISLVLAVGSGLLFWIVGSLFSNPIVAVFNSSGDPVLASMAAQGIILYFIAYVPMGGNIVTASFFSAVSRPVPSFLISFLRGVLIVLPALCLLSWLLGMTGVWLTIACAEGVTACVSLIFLKKYGIFHKKKPVNIS